jgi:S1-C subfamily serine protease
MKLAPLWLSFVLLCPVIAKDKPPEENEIVVLDPFKVRGDAVSNFAIDIRVIANAESKKVAQIIITHVYEDTDAADLGLQAGDEIVKIDGIPVEGMDSKIDIASQIGRIFLNRHPGDALRLEVITRRTQKITLRAQSSLRIR